MASIDETNVLFAQQRANIEQARQSSLAARKQLGEFQTIEKPTTAQLLARSRMDALSSIQAGKERTAIKERETQRLSDYEKSIAEAEQQLAAQESQFNRSVTESEEFQSGMKLGRSSDPAAFFAATTPAMKAGFKYAKENIQYGKEKAAYLNALKEPKTITTTTTRTIQTPTSLLQNVPMFAGGLKDTSGTPNMSRPEAKPIDTRTWLQKLYLKPSLEVQAARKPFSLFGQIDVGTEKLSDWIISKTPEGKVKELFKTESPVSFSAGSAVQWMVFAPLMQVGAAKKGSKQVAVQEEKAAEEPAKKITKEAVKQAIRENALRDPAANREALIKIIETGNKDAIKTATDLLKESLGENAAKTLVKDAYAQSSRAFMPEVVQKKTFEVIVPKPKPEPSGFAKIQIDTSKAIGATPAKLNVQGAGLALGLRGFQKSKPTLKQEQINFLELRNITDTTTKQKEDQKSKPIQDITQGTATVQTPISLTNLGSITLNLQTSMTQQRTVQRTQPKVTTTSITGFETPIWLKIKPSERAKKKGLISFGKKKSKAFQLFVKRRGKNILIGLPTTRGRALMRGESIARGTLARTFGLMPTSRTTEQEDIAYRPSQMFRSYKIRKGKRIPLKDTFVQEAKFSLSSIGERREIKSSRRKLNWL